MHLAALSRSPGKMRKDFAGEDIDEPVDVAGDLVNVDPIEARLHVLVEPVDVAARTKSFDS